MCVFANIVATFLSTGSDAIGSLQCTVVSLRSLDIDCISQANGNPATFDAEPTLWSRRSLAPLRSLFNLLRVALTSMTKFSCHCYDLIGKSLCTSLLPYMRCPRWRGRTREGKFTSSSQQLVPCFRSWRYACRRLEIVFKGRCFHDAAIRRQHLQIFSARDNMRSAFEEKRIVACASPRNAKGDQNLRAAVKHSLQERSQTQDFFFFCYATRCHR